MKKILSVVLAFLILCGGALPALADTTVILDGGHGGGHGFDRGGPGHGFGRGGPGPDAWWSHHYRPRPIYYEAWAPLYFAPRVQQPVVYQTTVVQQPVFVQSSGLGASQASPTYTDAQGRLCREYQTTAWMNNRQSEVYGTACLLPDGTWRVVQ